MQKIILLIISFILLTANGYAQTEDKNKTTQTYSESEIYTPRKLSEKDSKKPKKSKEKEQKTSSVSPGSTDTNITIPVTVFDNKGRIITGLKETDFHVFVNDKEVSDVKLEPSDQSLNLILLIDTSSSATLKLDILKTFLIDFTESLNPQDKVLIADFNEKLNVRTPLIKDRKIIKKAIDKLELGDGTSLYEAIDGIFSQQSSILPKQSAIILITDGVDTTSRKSNYEKSLETAEKFDIPVYVIYLDTYADGKKMSKSYVQLGFPPLTQANMEEYNLGRSYLYDLMNLSGGRVQIFDVDKTSKKAILPNFSGELRLKYYLTFKAPDNSENNKRNQIKIRIDRPNLFFYSKKTYIPN